MTLPLPFQTKSVSLLGSVFCVILQFSVNAQNPSETTRIELVQSGFQSIITSNIDKSGPAVAESHDVRFTENLKLKEIRIAGLPKTLPEPVESKDHSQYLHEELSADKRTAYQNYISSTSALRFDPLNSSNRARQALSLKQLGKPGLAAEIMRHTSLGDSSDAELVYVTAAFRSQEGNVYEAAKLIRKAMQLDHQINIDRLAGDDDFKNMRSSKEYLSFFNPNLNPEELRISNWRSDLRCLTSQVEATHANLFEKLNRQDWEYEINKLYAAIPDLNNYSIAMEFTRLIAMAKDPNTFLFPPINGPYKFNQLPVMFYPFDDGIYVRSASPKYAEIVGGKLVEIAGVKTKDALERLHKYIPHQNEQTLKWMAPLLLTIPEYLYGAGLADNMVQIPMKVVDTTNALVSVYFNSQRLFMDLLLTRTDHSTWPSARRKGPLPLYQKDPNNPWWFEYVPEKNIVYMQYNFLMDKQDQSTISYINQLMQTVENKNADALIIDVRQNNMVNETPYNPILIDALKSSSLYASGKIIIMQSYMTSGPASYLMANPQDCKHFIYAGDKNVGGAAFNRKDASIFLPNSQMMVSVASTSLRSKYKYDLNAQTETTIKSGLSFEQYRNNQDPLLEAVYRYLGK